jgi:hypothetical protein
MNMQYSEFKRKVLALPVIRDKDIQYFTDNFRAMRTQLTRWEDSGYLIRLRRGMYMLSAAERKITPSRDFLANQIYAPSYISLEYALSTYGLIPEAVFTLTSVTTRKTNSFTNPEGTFTYKHIHPRAFGGFRAFKDEQRLEFFIAEPEKAVVDFFYLNIDQFSRADKDIFAESYRFQNTESLQQKKIRYFSALFGSQRLERVCRLFCTFLREER